MESDFTFKTIGYCVVGLFFITALVVTSLFIRKTARTRAPVRGLLWLGMMMLGVCMFVALLSVFLR